MFKVQSLNIIHIIIRNKRFFNPKRGPYKFCFYCLSHSLLQNRFVIIPLPHNCLFFRFICFAGVVLIFGGGIRIYRPLWRGLILLEEWRRRQKRRKMARRGRRRRRRGLRVSIVAFILILLAMQHRTAVLQTLLTFNCF